MPYQPKLQEHPIGLSSRTVAAAVQDGQVVITASVVSVPVRFCTHITVAKHVQVDEGWQSDTAFERIEDGAPWPPALRQLCARLDLNEDATYAISIELAGALARGT